MGKYEVLTAFNDLENEGKRIEVGTVVELSDERYTTMADNAKFFGGIDAFLKPLTEEVKEEVKAEENEKAKKKEPKK